MSDHALGQATKKPPRCRGGFETLLEADYLTLAMLLAGAFLNLPAQLLQQNATV